MSAKLTGLIIGCTLAVMSQTGIKGMNSNVAPGTTWPIDQWNYKEYLQEQELDTQSVKELPSKNDKVLTFSDSLYVDRLNALSVEVDLTYNPAVRDHIERYTKNGRKQVSNLLGKGEYYFPLFEEVLDKEGLPSELKYLPVIESALNPVARSRAGATGLWQFMRGTGKSYGLEINNLVDERRDPVKSTYAAVRYLKDLYRTYQDWYLVIAAYNCGPGNVNKAISRSGGKTDYWDIYDYLPKETRRYVPAFIAATYVMNYHNEHDINSAGTDYTFPMESVKISKNMRFQHIAKITDMPLEDIRRYNPQFKKDIIPGGGKEYNLNLPVDKILALAGNDGVSYSGETLACYRMTDNGVASAFMKSMSPRVEARKVTVLYNIIKGDNISKVAKKNKVTVADLKKWNNLKNNRLRAGTALKIHKTEYIEVAPKLREPELLTVSVDTGSKVNALENYLDRIEQEINSQRLLNGLKASDDMRLYSITNNIDFRISMHTSSKKKNVLDRAVTFANTTYASIKEKVDSRTDKSATDNEQQVEFFAQNNKSENIPVAEKGTETNKNAGDYSLLIDKDDDSVDIYSNILLNDDARKVYHTVKIGETITKIASYYNVSKKDIILWNNLTTGMAKINQRLLIYLPKNDKLAELSFVER
ncbi:LysM peptidoglycan-binding domain-containing protein [Dysgonomonas sp. 521]|uniref:LysM peptidoglycan-binding domain-containing protein n=1 Tax=Dysgonomonas sp. 521 TaxID=2302932 RepID=UPI0013D4FD64|nr:transglycosylase SLT domain-containing protein [Dysgonomonas sp. 521]NDV95612.1 LysM peptidoglycan-binding domain-containing protein [Dysgonomonas sp. 521]